MSPSAYLIVRLRVRSEYRPLWKRDFGEDVQFLKQGSRTGFTSAREEYALSAVTVPGRVRVRGGGRPIGEWLRVAIVFLPGPQFRADPDRQD